MKRELKRYERYQDSGVEWLGEVPAHWEVKRLKDIGNSIIGITYSPEDVLDDGKEGVLVLRSSNIQNSKLCLKDTVFVNKRISKKQTVRQGDILICSRNGSRALIGKNIIIDELLAGNTFGAFMTVYRSKYFRFIHKFFNSKIFESQSGLYMSSTVNQLTINTLNNFFIALPPMVERKSIAIYLDEKTNRIDRKIELLQAKADRYRELKQALINETVTRGLDPTVPMKDSGVDWIGKVPAHWEVKRLKELGTVETSSIDKKTNDNEKLVSLVNYTDVYGNKRKEIYNSQGFMKVSANEKQIVSKNLKKGDVLFTPSSETIEDIGVSSVVMEDLKNTLYSYHLLRVRFRKVFDLNFKKYAFNSSYAQFYFSKSAKGTTRKILGLNIFNNLQMIIPNYDEQKAIAAYLDTKTAQIEQIITTITTQIQTLQELRKTLINDVVTGKIKVV